MINNSKGKLTEKTPELNTLMILIQSLKSQLQNLASVNKNIEFLNSELSGGISRKEEKEKVKKITPIPV